jgi:protein-S-isoprenylcysteine O-methyltransferase Ste14
MNTLQVFITIGGSLLIVWFSWWLSIREGRYHGIYRFFAFESILILCILNAHVWFSKPFSPHQLISWILLVASAIMALHGYWLLTVLGKPDGKFENTSVIVTRGAYKYIRHPLYCSLLLLGTGVFLKDPISIPGFAIAWINMLALYFTAREEEKEMIAKFGDAYRHYMKYTTMFIPYLF